MREVVGIGLQRKADRYVIVKLLCGWRSVVSSFCVNLFFEGVVPLLKLFPQLMYESTALHVFPRARSAPLLVMR